jgi:uncharacterized protein (TIGR03435 family)
MTSHAQRWALRFLAALALTPIATAQQQSSDAPLPAFDIVSIKQHDPRDLKGVAKSTPDGLHLINILLGDIIREAYSVHFNGQIADAPAWLRSTRFDIEAKVAEADLPAFHHLTHDQLRLMVRSILTDRFSLKLHHETKPMPVYALTVAKNGLKMKQATPGDTYPNGFKGGDGVIRSNSMAIRRESAGENQIRAQGITITRLVDALSEGEQDRMVIDRTGLTEKYDFSLTWTQNQNSSTDTDSPSLFAAVEEQLGLKLEATKTPVDTIVIDHIEMPSSN